MIEEDFMINQVIILAKDGYSMTCAANLTKSLSPTTLNCCFEQVAFIFIIQMLTSYFFLHDYIEKGSRKNFQSLDPMLTSVRIIFSILIQQQVLTEL